MTVGGGMPGSPSAPLADHAPGGSARSLGLAAMEETVPTLPRGARLLHIGIPKTGTTALQRAAAENRSVLLQHGVCYPGRTVNHREAVCALMGRPFGWRGAGESVPAMGHWNRVRAELDAHPDCRGFVSHEFASECTDEQARKFHDAFGADLHVVVTLRGFAHLLGSSWQQYVKAGRRRAFRPWLTDILADEPQTDGANAFYRRNDQGAVVDRWVRLVGPERLTVVIVDKNRPGQLTDAFEDLLGLPRGMLGADQGGLDSNRALSWPEVELLRRLNVAARKSQLTWGDYDQLVRAGGVARLLQNRRPQPDEPMVRLPRWAAEQATRRAHTYAEAVDATGCRVVGDLDTLSDPVPAEEALPARPDVPIDAAVELATGLLSASLGRGAFFDIEAKATTPALRRVARTARGRRWLELAQRNAAASPLDQLVVALASLVRSIPSLKNR